MTVPENQAAREVRGMVHEKVHAQCERTRGRVHKWE